MIQLIDKEGNVFREIEDAEYEGIRWRSEHYPRDKEAEAKCEHVKIISERTFVKQDDGSSRWVEV